MRPSLYRLQVGRKDRVPRLRRPHKLVASIARLIQHGRASPRRSRWINVMYAAAAATPATMTKQLLVYRTASTTAYIRRAASRTWAIQNAKRLTSTAACPGWRAKHSKSTFNLNWKTVIMCKYYFVGLNKEGDESICEHTCDTRNEWQVPWRELFCTVYRRKTLSYI